MRAERAAKLEAMAAEAFAEVKRAHLSGLSAVVSLLVIDEAYRKAGRLRRAAIAMETQRAETENTDSVAKP